MNVDIEEGFSPQRFGRVPLVAIPQPQYDSEWLVGGSIVTVFFQRQLGQSFKHTMGTKDITSTSMVMSSCLSKPMNFLMTGFNLYFARGTDSDDIGEIVNKGAFQFAFAGNRVYYTTPLCRFNIGNDVSEKVFLRGDVVEKLRKQKIKDQSEIPLDWDFNTQYDWNLAAEELIKRERDMLNFSVGGVPLRIQPYESFQASLRFEQALKLSKPVRMWCFLEGRTFLPL